ncbi:MAG: acyloxyacyl hydrolase [Candidatus Rokuibacteriota bacterium]
MRRGAGVLALALAVVLAPVVVPAAAFDPERTFRPRAFVVSAEGGYGEQDNFDDFARQAGLDFWNAGIRFSVLPLGLTGPGLVRGALEIGLEPFYQRYDHPGRAFLAGAGIVGRYHFTALGRFVPYVEVAGFAGCTDLEILEINSAFTFLVFGGVGASFFVADAAAVYAGYRYQHVSNGNTATPNRGFESSTGVAGVSFFFE